MVNTHPAAVTHMHSTLITDTGKQKRRESGQLCEVTRRRKREKYARVLRGGGEELKGKKKKKKKRLVEMELQ